MKKLKKVESIEKLETTEEFKTVPPKIDGVKKSSRISRQKKSRKSGEVRKGLKPIGENGVLWKSKIDMKRMFK